MAKERNLRYSNLKNRIMKSLSSKLFLVASVVLLGIMTSCKEKNTENNTDADMPDTTTVVEPTAPATPDTATVPTDTTKTPMPK